jgi:hypothetical protein
MKLIISCRLFLIVSVTGSTSDLSEIGSIYGLSTIAKQRSDSLTNLFNMSEDSTSLSNLSIASYSLSQHSCENGSYTNPTTYTTVSPVTISPSQQQTSTNNESDKISRKQYTSSYRSLTEEQNSPTNNRKLNPNNPTRRSGDSTRHYHFYSTNLSGSSSTTSSQKSFPVKTAETVLNTIGINTSSSNNDLTDKCGLIAHDGNDIENNDDEKTTNQHDDQQTFCDGHYVDSSDENELDMTSSRNNSTQTGRGLRKTVLNNVDRLLNSGNKQIKL